MFYRTYYQPDQGYYTQQPATVAQVNNLWGFIKAMRDDLSRAVSEFNSHEFNLDKSFEEARKHTDTVKNELSKRLDRLQDDFDSLDALLGETAANLERKITNLETDKISDVSLSGEGDTIKMAVSNGTSTDYENVKFVTPKNETAVITETHEAPDGTIQVAQSAPYLDDSVIASKFSVREAAPNVASVTYAGAAVGGVKIDSDLLSLDVADGNAIVVTTEGAQREIDGLNDSVSEINHSAQSVLDSAVYPRELNDEINITVSRESLDGKTRTEQNMPLISNGGQFSTEGGKIRYEPADEFAEKFGEVKYTTSEVYPEMLRIVSETIAYKYNPLTEKVTRYEPYNYQELAFDGKGTQNVLANFVYDETRDVVAIDTSRLEAEYNSQYAVVKGAIDRLKEKITELENEVAYLKARDTNAIVQVEPVIRAASNDKIVVSLERVFADGSHDESEPVIFNFRNNDHTMSIITRNNQTVPSQCDVQINMDKIWLNRQGLDRDMDTY